MLTINRNLMIFILALLVAILSVATYVLFQQASVNTNIEQTRLEKEAATKKFRGQKYIPKYNGKGF